MESENNDGTHNKGARLDIVAFYKKICDSCFIYKYKDDVDYDVMCHFTPGELIIYGVLTFKKSI